METRNLAKELRIENLIEYQNRVFEIWEVRRSDLELDSETLDLHIHSVKYESVKPVLLTEEWLLKFGFEKQYNEADFDYWFKKGFCDDILWEHSEGFCHNLNYGGDIEYVHQLQNLYFALTGEELEINLTQE